MTITRSDLKIFKPELLGSSDDAGGQRTRNVVQSGKLNELFTAISDIDHAQSAIDIVKCYPGLDTADTSVLLDGHVFISEPPTDPLVSMILAQSDALNDYSRMTDMKEILESSVTAGSLIRKGAPGFLPNQNSFSRDYLESTYMFNNKEYRKTTNLRVGQVICITVEYTGIDNKDWPRIQHFCVVTDTSAPGNSQGSVVFDPPIDTATPERQIVINGQSDCTRLRLVNDASPVIFHGVSKLTAVANANLLNLGSTSQHLIPVVESEHVNSALKITDSTGLIRKSISQGSGLASTYTFDTPDLLRPADDSLGIQNINVDYRPICSYISGGKTYGNDDAVINTTDTSITVTVARPVDAMTSVSVSYLSTNQYDNYDNKDPFPSDVTVTRNTITGYIEYKGSTLQIEEREDGIYGSGGGTTRLGIMDYSTGIITYSPDASNARYTALVGGAESIKSAEFIMPVERPVLDTFYVRVESTTGTLLSGSSDPQGVITGTNVSGTITGNVVKLAFVVDVKLSTLNYDVTETVSNLPPADVYGLNPLRIPNSGLVPIFTKWGTVSVQHTQYQAAVGSIGTKYTVRTGARFVDITDANGLSLWTPTDINFTYNKDAGEVTINSDFTGFTAPYVLTDSIGELALVTGVGSNHLNLAASLTREYPMGSTVASVQILGDQQARVGKVRDMTSWDGNWDVDGLPADANMNVVDYPIEVTNETAANEDWVLIFKTDTSFRCVGRRLGQIAVGDTLNDFVPMNPFTNSPYFTIRKDAFGGGWNAGEAIRFESYGAATPVMPIRTVQAGHSQITTDRVVLSYRGNDSN